MTYQAISGPLRADGRAPVSAATGRAWSRLCRALARSDAATAPAVSGWGWQGAGALCHSSRRLSRRRPVATSLGQSQCCVVQYFTTLKCKYLMRVTPVNVYMRVRKLSADVGGHSLKHFILQHIKMIKYWESCST